MENITKELNSATEYLQSMKKSGHHKGDCDNILMHLANIEELSNKLFIANVMQWMAVDDKLPEDGGYYDCCLENGSVTNCLYTISDNKWFLRDGTEVRQHNKVVNWIKMPEPPCA